MSLDLRNVESPLHRPSLCTGMNAMLCAVTMQNGADRSEPKTLRWGLTQATTDGCRDETAQGRPASECQSRRACAESDSASSGRVAPHFLGKGEKYNIAMDIWLPVSGMTLLEEEEMPEFVASPSSYVTIRNVMLEKWHADCTREYSEEQAQQDAPRVFHHPEAQR